MTMASIALALQFLRELHEVVVVLERLAQAVEREFGHVEHGRAPAYLARSVRIGALHNGVRLGEMADLAALPPGLVAGVGDLQPCEVVAAVDALLDGAVEVAGDE